MRRRRLAFVQQLERTDCGDACLLMVLSYFGSDIARHELRELSGTDIHGTTATQLLAAGEALGLRGEALKVGVNRIPELPRGAILHWGFNHFVVLSRYRAKGVEIADPAVGMRTVSHDEVRKKFTGVALVFERGDGFVERRARRWRWTDLLQYLRGEGLWGPILLASILMQILGLGVPVLVGSLVDRVVPQGDRDLLGVLALVMAGVVLLFALTAAMRGYLLLFVRARMDLRISTTFMNRMVELPYSFFLRRGSGDLLARLNSNIAIRQILTTTALSAVLDGATVMIYLVVLTTQSLTMTALVVILLAVEVGVLVGTWRVGQDLMRATLEAQATSQSQAVQLLAGIETLKATGTEGRAAENWTKVFTSEVDTTLRRGKYSNVTDSLMASIRLGAPVLLLVYGAYAVLRGDLSLGSALTVNTLAITMLGPAASLVATVLQLQMVPAYMERIEDVVKTPTDAPGERALEDRPGTLAAEGVTFSYTRLGAPALSDVSLSVEPGQFVAVVGASGSGKSTLGSLLAGLHQPVLGTVRYQGLPLPEIANEDLRSHVAIVPQHPYLFATTIKDNIALAAPNAPFDAIVAAATIACIHDDVEAMPSGYDTVLADAGASLSGGQRQRLAIARALLVFPHVLILDEATSALDRETEIRVHANLSAMACSTVLISHRLRSIRNADVIVVLEGGRIVERGDHRHLAERGPIYRRLFGLDAGVEVDTGTA